MRELVFGNSRVRLRLDDEAWWINRNTASPALLEVLLPTTGSDRESGRRLAIAVSEWVGSAPVARPQNIVLADYQAAGLDYGPPGAPLETMQELGRVLGMTPAVFAVIRPHLTLFGPAQPSASTTDPVVAAPSPRLRRRRQLLSLRSRLRMYSPCGSPRSPSASRTHDLREPGAGKRDLRRDPVRHCPCWSRAASRL